MNRGAGSGHNRILHVPRSEDELLLKLEAIRLICRCTGCAQRYLGGGSPAATKKEVFRRHPIAERVELVANLLDRGMLADACRRRTKRATTAHFLVRPSLPTLIW